MLTANANLEIRPHAPTGGYGKSNQFADAVLVEHLERIVLYYTSFDVRGQKAAGVVATEAKRRLR
jgi:hypothetical protein